MSFQDATTTMAEIEYRQAQVRRMRARTACVGFFEGLVNRRTRRSQEV